MLISLQKSYLLIRISQQTKGNCKNRKIVLFHNASVNKYFGIHDLKDNLRLETEVQT